MISPEELGWTEFWLRLGVVGFTAFGTLLVVAFVAKLISAVLRVLRWMSRPLWDRRG